MSTCKNRRQLALFTTLLLCLLHPVVGAQEQASPALGQAVSESQLQALDLIAAPDGQGLPDGSGTAAQGEALYRNSCASCHGMEGEGLAPSSRLVGGDMQAARAPIKTVASYWPHASTLFDFIRRAMPANAPKSLSDEQVYQAAAYVLYLNGLLEREEVLDRERLLQVQMPNANGFIDMSDSH